MNSIDISSTQEDIPILQKKLEAVGYIFFLKFDEESPKKILSRFGEHSLQEDGQPYYTVQAGSKLQPADGGKLMPHTDDFNALKDPPRLIALHCINPGTGSGGETLLADGYSWIRTLTPETIQLLKRPWRYKRENGFADRPFLSATMTLRVSFGHLEFSHDAQMSELMAQLLRWFESAAFSVTYQPGSLLLWSNWRMIHGRGKYNDLNRELHRYHLN